MVRYKLFGSLELQGSDGRVVPVDGQAARILRLLVLRAGQTVSVEDLQSLLEPPTSGEPGEQLPVQPPEVRDRKQQLIRQVHEVRGRIGRIIDHKTRLITEGTARAIGYRLNLVDGDSTDWQEYRDLVRRAEDSQRAGRYVEALELAGTALAQDTSDPLGELGNYGELVYDLLADYAPVPATARLVHAIAEVGLGLGTSETERKLRKFMEEDVNGETRNAYVWRALTWLADDLRGESGVDEVRQLRAQLLEPQAAHDGFVKRALADKLTRAQPATDGAPPVSDGEPPAANKATEGRVTDQQPASTDSKQIGTASDDPKEQAEESPPRGPTRRRPNPRMLVTVVVVLLLVSVSAWVVMQQSKSRMPDPLRATVEVDPTKLTDFMIGEEFDFVIPRGTAITGGPGIGCQDMLAWATALGGVPAAPMTVRLALTNISSQRVDVQGISADLPGDPAPMLAGTRASCPPQGEQEVRQLGIDLDGARPAGEFTNADGNPKVITLEPGESEYVDVTFETSRCHCTWGLELFMNVGGEPVSQRVLRNGEPLRVTAWQGREFYSWQGDTWYRVSTDPWPGDFGTPQPQDKPLPPLS